MLFFQAQNAPKPIFDRDSVPDPTGGTYDGSPDPLVDWGGGYLLLIFPLRLLRLNLAFYPHHPTRK